MLQHVIPEEHKMLQKSHFVARLIHEFNIYFFVINFWNFNLHFVDLSHVALILSCESEFHFVLTLINLWLIALLLQMLTNTCFYDIGAPCW